MSDDRAGSRPKILAAEFHFHRAVRVDEWCGTGSVAATAPGMERETDSRFAGGYRFGIAALMPAPFPIDQFRGFAQLGPIDFRPERVVGILIENSTGSIFNLAARSSKAEQVR